MSILRMPANLVMPSQKTNRRSMIRGAAGLGLGIGAASAFGNVFAQDHDHSTPVAGGESGGGVISSDASTETTGDATPPTDVEATPFERYNPYLEPVEPGDKEFTITAQDRIVEIPVPHRPVRPWAPTQGGDLTSSVYPSWTRMSASNPVLQVLHSAYCGTCARLLHHPREETASMSSMTVSR